MSHKQQDNNRDDQYIGLFPPQGASFEHSGHPNPQPTLSQPQEFSNNPQQGQSNYQQPPKSTTIESFFSPTFQSINHAHLPTDFSLQPFLNSTSSPPFQSQNSRRDHHNNSNSPPTTPLPRPLFNQYHHPSTSQQRHHFPHQLSNHSLPHSNHLPTAQNSQHPSLLPPPHTHIHDAFTNHQHQRNQSTPPLFDSDKKTPPLSSQKDQPFALLNIAQPKANNSPSEPRGFNSQEQAKQQQPSKQVTTQPKALPSSPPRPPVLPTNIDTLLKRLSSTVEPHRDEIYAGIGFLLSILPEPKVSAKVQFTNKKKSVAFTKSNKKHQESATSSVVSKPKMKQSKDGNSFDTQSSENRALIDPATIDYHNFFMYYPQVTSDQPEPSTEAISSSDFSELNTSDKLCVQIIVLQAYLQYARSIEDKVMISKYQQDFSGAVLPLEAIEYTSRNGLIPRSVFLQLLERLDNPKFQYSATNSNATCICLRYISSRNPHGFTMESVKDITKGTSTFNQASRVEHYLIQQLSTKKNGAAAISHWTSGTVVIKPPLVQGGNIAQSFVGSQLAQNLHQMIYPVRPTGPYAAIRQSMNQSATTTATNSPIVTAPTDSQQDTTSPIQPPTGPGSLLICTTSPSQGIIFSPSTAPTYPRQTSSNEQPSSSSPRNHPMTDRSTPKSSSLDTHALATSVSAQAPPIAAQIQPTQDHLPLPPHTKLPSNPSSSTSTRFSDNTPQTTHDHLQQHHPSRIKATTEQSFTRSLYDPQLITTNRHIFDFETVPRETDPIEDEKFYHAHSVPGPLDLHEYPVGQHPFSQQTRPSQHNQIEHSKSTQEFLSQHQPIVLCSHRTHSRSNSPPPSSTQRPGTTSPSTNTTTIRSTSTPTNPPKSFNQSLDALSTQFPILKGIGLSHEQYQSTLELIQHGYLANPEMVIDYGIVSTTSSEGSCAKVSSSNPTTTTHTSTSSRPSHATEPLNQQQSQPNSRPNSGYPLVSLQATTPNSQYFQHSLEGTHEDDLVSLSSSHSNLINSPLTTSLQSAYDERESLSTTSLLSTRSSTQASQKMRQQQEPNPANAFSYVHPSANINNATLSAFDEQLVAKKRSNVDSRGSVASASSAVSTRSTLSGRTRLSGKHGSTGRAQNSSPINILPIDPSTTSQTSMPLVKDKVLDDNASRTSFQTAHDCNQSAELHRSSSSIGIGHPNDLNSATPHTTGQNDQDTNSSPETRPVKRLRKKRVSPPRISVRSTRAHPFIAQNPSPNDEQVLSKTAETSSTDPTTLLTNAAKSLKRQKGLFIGRVKVPMIVPYSYLKILYTAPTKHQKVIRRITYVDLINADATHFRIPKHFNEFYKSFGLREHWVYTNYSNDDSTGEKAGNDDVDFHDGQDLDTNDSTPPAPRFTEHQSNFDARLINPFSTPTQSSNIFNSQHYHQTPYSTLLQQQQLQQQLDGDNLVQPAQYNPSSIFPPPSNQ